MKMAKNAKIGFGLGATFLVTGREIKSCGYNNLYDIEESALKRWQFNKEKGSGWGDDGLILVEVNGKKFVCEELVAKKNGWNEIEAEWARCLRDQKQGV